VLLKLSVPLILAHFDITPKFFLYKADRLLLLCGENLNFLDLCDLSVQHFPPVVLVLTQAAILNDHILALLGAPDLVLKLFLLSGLPLHKLYYHLLTFLLL